MSTVDKKMLFKPRLPEADVIVEGIGTVRVRALNRREAISVQRLEDPAERDVMLFVIGLVDPKLTEDEVRRWIEAAPADEMEPVQRRIAELSGMLPESAKEAVKSFIANPDEEFRALSGTEAVNDGGAATRGDVG